MFLLLALRQEVVLFVSLPIFTNWVRSKPLSKEAAALSGLNLGHITPQMKKKKDALLRTNN